MRYELGEFAVSAYRPRYDKLAADYIAFIKAPAIRNCLRAYESAP